MLHRTPDPMRADSVAGTRVRVLCVDDDPHIRGVISTVIARAPGFHQVGEASSGEDAMTAAASLRPDLILMDVRMTGIDGFEAASRLLERSPELRVALMSAQAIVPPPGFDPPAGSVAFVPKAELCPRGLLELWRRLEKS